MFPPYISIHTFVVSRHQSLMLQIRVVTDRMLFCEFSIPFLVSYNSQHVGFYAPNFEKVGDILVLACPYVCVFVCIHVRDIVLKLHVWIPHGKIADAYFWFSLNYLPLLNYGPLTNKGMKFCKCRISKSIIARNLKFIMLIGYDD